MDNRDLHSVKKLGTALKDKKISAKEAAQFFLTRIEKHASLNAFRVVCPDVALTRAEESDKRRAAGEARGLLDGVPVGVKDLFCTEGVSSEACSNILKGFTPNYESTVTQKLRDAGAVMLGKTNMDEFAMGSANLTSACGKVANPWRSKEKPEETLVPGGSSGGSAAAQAAGLCPFATGSDTGGSIRQPAAFCGIVGIKPTYGRCSRWGMIAFASSLDQAGIFANDVEDAAITLEAVSGYDPKDSTSHPEATGSFSAEIGASVKGKRIGVPKEYALPQVPEEVNALWRKAAERFKDAGAEIVEISLPHTDYALPTYYVIAPAEASANLARYDGVRYGTRAEGDFASLDELYAKTRAQGFGDEVKRRIMIGTYVLSSGYYDAYYVKAQKVRARIAEDFAKAFASVDVLLTPATPTPAFPADRKTDPMMMYLNDVFTVPASLAGLPAMTVPVGYSADGLPLGLQLITPHFTEARLFRFARFLEEASGFKGYTELHG
jgi:aspartyl-tRNA(Asn)/glutamyl-tRNA(Gln) amidotransferase subunit A